MGFSLEWGYFKWQWFHVKLSINDKTVIYILNKDLNTPLAVAIFIVHIFSSCCKVNGDHLTDMKIMTILEIYKSFFGRETLNLQGALTCIQKALYDLLMWKLLEKYYFLLKFFKKSAVCNFFTIFFDENFCLIMEIQYSVDLWWCSHRLARVQMVKTCEFHPFLVLFVWNMTIKALFPLDLYRIQLFYFLCSWF